MPIGSDASPHTPDDTLIDHLARRLGRVWNQLEPIESISDGEARADALSAQADAVNAIKLLISTTSALTLSDAAMQLALAYRVADIGASDTDEEERQRADTMVMRLIASTLLRLLDTADVRVDPAALEAMFPADQWRTVWNHMA
jgi:hypothetical protein